MQVDDCYVVLLSIYMSSEIRDCGRRFRELENSWREQLNYNAHINSFPALYGEDKGLTAEQVEREQLDIQITQYQKYLDLKDLNEKAKEQGVYWLSVFPAKELIRCGSILLGKNDTYEKYIRRELETLRGKYKELIG